MDLSNVDLSAVEWRKSSRSQGTSNNCVEVALLSDGNRAVRDSKNPTGPSLAGLHRQPEDRQPHLTGPRLSRQQLRCWSASVVPAHGDGPDVSPAGEVSVWCSPHTRGWS